MPDDPRVLRALASIVAPPLCAICARPCEPAATLCRGCERKLTRLRPQRTLLHGGLELISAAPYEGVARELTRRLKFSARLALAELAAERMARAWGAARPGYLVPVPPAPARERARGFDDAAILARLVARQCVSAQMLPCLVRADGPRQVKRSRSERTADPPRVFLARPSSVLPPGDIWLVDDVATTGATLASCARILAEHGAVKVGALTFARADS